MTVMAAVVVATTMVAAGGHSHPSVWSISSHEGSNSFSSLAPRAQRCHCHTTTAALIAFSAITTATVTVVITAITSGVAIVIDNDGQQMMDTATDDR